MCPSGQSVQVVCPNNENVPSEHAVIGDAGLGQEYPRGQRTHSAIPWDNDREKIRQLQNTPQNKGSMTILMKEDKYVVK